MDERRLGSAPLPSMNFSSIQLFLIPHGWAEFAVIVTRLGPRRRRDPILQQDEVQVVAELMSDLRK